MEKTLRRSRKGFFITENALFDMPPTLTLHAIVVYTCLQRYAGNEDTAFPSFETLLEKCRIKSDKTLTKAINCLIEHGLLKKEIRYCKEGPHKGQRTSNLYTLYDPSEILEPVSNTGNSEGLTVLNTVKLTVPDTVKLTVPDTVKQDSLKTEQNTLKNKTQLNSQNPVKLSQVTSSTPTISQQKKTKETIKKKKEKPLTEAEAVAEVKKQIDYHLIRQQYLGEKTPDNTKLSALEDIISVLAEGLRSTKDYWLISNENIPTEEIRRKYQQIEMLDVIGFIEQLKKSPKEIKHPHAYYKAALYRLKLGEDVQITSQFNASFADRRQSTSRR